MIGFGTARRCRPAEIIMAVTEKNGEPGPDGPVFECVSKEIPQGCWISRSQGKLVVNVLYRHGGSRILPGAEIFEVTGLGGQYTGGDYQVFRT